MAVTSEIEQYVIDRVRALRIEAGLGQEKLSVMMGLNSKFVGNVESPRTADKYNINHLNKIAEVIHCSIKDFFPDQPFEGDLPKRGQS